MSLTMPVRECLDWKARQSWRFAFDSFQPASMSGMRKRQVR